MVGGWSPLLLIVAAVPMVAVILCFGELNRAEPDCGTCYSWTSRALRPRAGQLTGWIVIAACVLVMTNLIQMAAVYLFTVLGADSLAESRLAQAVAGVALLAAMAWLAYRGITVAARVQVALLIAELLGLVWFAGAALLADPLPQRVEVDPSFSGVVAAFLVAVFLYWGWDSSFSVNEESTEPTRTPVAAALWAMAALVVLYAGFTWAVTRYAGAGLLAEIGEGDLTAVLADRLLGSSGGTLLAGAILASALASAQTTILPSARSVVAMAHRGDLPAPLGAVQANGSPTAATWSITVLSAIAYVALVFSSEAMLADSVAATALLVAGYYLITCATVPLYFGRAAWQRPWRRMLLPVATAVLFVVVLAESIRDASTTTLAVTAVVAVLGGVVLPWARTRLWA
ncbi:Putative amino acid permease YhdG [Nocardioides dubius]|uniref:Amino acid transporter n=1 Tax=Nocardioides dubius TaxID=317019 RepID=A0ABN1TQL0_9ACTN